MDHKNVKRGTEYLMVTSINWYLFSREGELLLYGYESSTEQFFAGKKRWDIKNILVAFPSLMQN